MKRLIMLLLCLCMMLPLVAMLPLDALAADGDAKFTLEKTTFVQGEPIMVTPIGEGKDWIGIAPKGKVNSGGIHWCYIAAGTGSGLQAGHGSGTPVDIRTVYAATGHEAYHGIPVGEYTVFWVPNNGAAGTKTYTVDITVVMGTNKTTYTYGEPIMVTALDTGTNGDWIGIAKKDEVTGGSVRYKYIAKDVADQRPASKGAGSGVAVDIRTGAIAGNRDSKADIGVGTWTVFWVSKGMSSAQYATYSIDITVTDGPMTLDKTEYYVGDPIMLTAKMAGTDTKTWCGIVPDVDGKPYGSYGTIIWYELYNDPKNKDTATAGVDPVAVDLRAHTGDGFGTMGNQSNQKNCAAMMGCTVKSMFSLPAGTYWVVYCSDSTGLYQGSGITHMIQIKIKPVLTVNKTEFAYGEPIMVTPIGEGKDWVFIAPKHEDDSKNNYSIRWTYIDPSMGSGSDKGKGSGTAIDIRQATHSSNYPDLGLLPPGEYSLFMVFDPNSGAGSADHGTRIDIVISGEAPDAPTDVTYDLTSKTTGLANGTVTVKIDPDKFANVSTMPTHAILYWGDANGPLAAYTEIGYRPLTAATTTIAMIPDSVIPNEATHLWVATYNGAGVSETMFSVQLPTDRTYPELGEEKLSFQIVSDVHSKASTTGLIRIESFFNDVKLIDPDSAGIFVSGDITDTGSVTEYENLYALWDKILGSQSDVKIPFFPAIGNHEFKPDGTMSGYGDYTAKQARFIEYLNQYLAAAGKDQITNGKHYYDLWIGEGEDKYHFIFLASEVSGTNAYISDAQLAWLDEILAEDRKNGHPSFIMLHQCLYNTVSGGMPAHGWNGVVAGDQNWLDWEQEVGASNAPTNRNMKDKYEAPLRDILRKYPEAMMFSGHSHWAMSDINNMYNPYFPTDESNALPNYLFNTGAVDYLASALTGKDISGSQGYYVYIYEDYIEFRGRDFANQKWIPNATYRIALDELCIHENAESCAEECPDCGKTLTPTADHKGQYDCSTTCKWCSTPIPPAKNHESEKPCDTTCKYCGEDVAIATAAHSYSNACDTTCNECGAVREVDSHIREFECSTACMICEHPFDESEPHRGEYACSECCIYCGQQVVEQADGAEHTYIYECDEICAVCYERIEPKAAHDNLYDCSDTCRYCHEDLGLSTAEHSREVNCSEHCSLCSEPIQRLGDHVRLYPCSEVCANCKEAVIPDPAPHDRGPECSERCKYCNEDMIHNKDHENLHECSTICKYCNQPVAPTPTGEHVRKDECSTVCEICHESIPAQKDHERLYPCSELCKYCEEAVIPNPDEHDRGPECSDTCQICSAALPHLKDHENAHDCSDLCIYCGEHVIPTDGLAQHQRMYSCSDQCKICGAAIQPATPHESDFACSGICKHCNKPVLMGSDAHEGRFPCSNTCVCGVTIVPISDHESDYACSNICKHCNEAVVYARAEHAGEFVCSDTCATCGIALPPAEHVYSAWHPHDATQHKKLCECGDAIYADHTWDNGEVTTPPTTEAKGEKTFTCTDCNATRTEAIDALPVATPPSTEGSESTTDNNADNSDGQADANGGGLPAGAIVAIVIGAILLLGGGGFAIWWFLLRKKKTA